MGRVEVRFGSVKFQYLGVESSVYRQYIVSILVYMGRMCVGLWEEWGERGAVCNMNINGGKIITFVIDIINTKRRR